VQSFLTTISRLIHEQDLPALMIGGHAVTALGHPRATFDLDLLIPKSSSGKWRTALATLRYQIFAESANFLQFEAARDLPLPPVDLMLVADEVFVFLEKTKVDLTPLATPSVIAMVGLKLHAIHQPARASAAQDWADILALVKAHKLSLDDPEFSATVLRHGGDNAVARIKTAIDCGD
jgi:hypothetical protein